MFANIMARWYFSRFPIERGKWRLWTSFLNTASYREIGGGVQKLKHGVRMSLDPQNYIELFCCYWRCWEPNETRVIRGLIKPGDVFVDVGANIGYFSLLAARAVGDRGRVLAIEPVPTTAAKLRANVALNNLSNVALHEVAVSQQPGLLRIFQPHDNNLGANTIRSSEGTERFWDVPATTLDDLLAEEPRIGLMKLDLEGAELLALRGFAGHLAAPDAPPVLCEVTDPFLRELGVSAAEIYEFMENFGYKAFRCANLGLSSVGRDDFAKGCNMSVLFAKNAHDSER